MSQIVAGTQIVEAALGAPSALLAGSSAFAALIWWVVPLTGLIGATGYVLWISKFKSKFETETSRSVVQFQRFQDSFRQSAPEDEKK